MSRTVVLLGGPGDGRQITLPDKTPLAYEVPVRGSRVEYKRETIGFLVPERCAAVFDELLEPVHDVERAELHDVTTRRDAVRYAVRVWATAERRLELRIEIERFNREASPWVHATDEMVADEPVMAMWEAEARDALARVIALMRPAE